MNVDLAIAVLKALAEDWIFLIVAVVLSAYSLLSRRSMRLPQLPLGLPILFLLLTVAASLIQPFGFLKGIAGWTRVVSIVVMTWAAARLAFAVFIEMPNQVRRKPPITRITRDFVLGIAYVCLAAVVLRTQGNVNLASLLTTSAVLTVVLGLAAQAVLSSFFSGLILQIERPFEVGDWISLGDQVGKVLGITWQSTRLVTRDGVMIYVPNSQLATGIFVNHSKPHGRNIAKIRIGLEYDAPPNLARDVILEVLAKHPRVLKDPEQEVRVVDFADFAVIYEIRFWHSDFGLEDRTKSEICSQLWYALRRNGIRIPFPIRDVRFAHIERRREQAGKAGSLDEVERLLSSVSVFEPLGDKERRLLAESIVVESFGKNELVVRQGDPSDSLYVIRSGSCAVTIDEPGNAGGRHLATMKAGDFFGEMSLLTGEPRKATVRAVEDTVLFKVQKDDFSRIVKNHERITALLAEALQKRQQELGSGSDSVVETPTAVSLVGRIKAFLRLG